jgi:flagellin
MSLFAMQLANAFFFRELSISQSLLKNSIHKLSSGKRLIKSRDDTGMLSVQMKMNADNYRNASAMDKIGNAVSFLDTQDGMLSNAQNILARMSELKGLSTNDPIKSEQDIDSYNNEFHDLQKQLYQLSKQTFNGTSFFATTTEKLGRSVDIAYYLEDGIKQLSFKDNQAPFFKVKNVQISAVKKDSGHTNIGYSDRLNNNGTIALAVKSDVSLAANFNEVQMSYFNQAIENISYLRADASTTKSRLEFIGDSIQNFKAHSSTAIGRISDVDYALENSKLAKQKIMTSSSAAMIAQANSMGDVLLTMLN